MLQCSKIKFELCLIYLCDKVHNMGVDYGAATILHPFLSGSLLSGGLFVRGAFCPRGLLSGGLFVRGVFCQGCFLSGVPLSPRRHPMYFCQG